jgi:DNA-binding MarR family transcriptional regulator
MSSAREATFEATTRVRDACLCLHAQRAARALARRFDEAFRPLSLTSGQFSILNALNRPAPAGMGQVASLLSMDRTTLTAALKPLVRRGLVAPGAAPSDRRSRPVTLTAAGRAILADAIVLWTAAHADIEANLPALEPDRLRTDLRAISTQPDGHDTQRDKRPPRPGD